MGLSGVSHLSLTVSDLPRSCQWYTDVLGWDQKMTGRTDTTSFAYGILPDGTTLVLRIHDEPIAVEFDERRPGLDHVSFATTELNDLAEVERRIRSVGSRYTPTQIVPYGHVLTFRDPDNTTLEMVYTP